MTVDEIRAMNLEELESRSAAIADETTEADEAKLAELNMELDAIEARKLEINKEIETRKNDVEAVISGRGVEIRTGKEEKEMTEKEIRSSKRYIDAYVDYIKGKNDGSECRAMLKDAEYRMPDGGGDSSNFKILSENATNGIVPVPTYVEGRIETAWENDEIMSRVRKTFLKGNVKVGVEMAATGAAIHTEGGDAPAAEELTLAIVELIPQTIKKWVSVSSEVMDLNGEAFLDYIYDEIMYRIVKKAAEVALDAIANAPTSGTSAPTVSVETVSTMAITDIVNAIGQLSGAARNLVFIANNATIAAYRALAMSASYAVDPFAGVTVIATDSLPAFASATGEFAIVGDLGAIQANYPAGDDVKFIFDEFSLAEMDLIKIVGRQYVGIGLVNDKAFTVLSK